VREPDADRRRAGEPDRWSALPTPLYVSEYVCLAMCIFVGALPPVRLRLQAAGWGCREAEKALLQALTLMGKDRKKQGTPLGTPEGRGRDKPLLCHLIYYSGRAAHRAACFFCSPRSSRNLRSITQRAAKKVLFSRLHSRSRRRGSRQLSAQKKQIGERNIRTASGSSEPSGKETLTA